MGADHNSKKGNSAQGFFLETLRKEKQTGQCWDGRGKKKTWQFIAIGQTVEEILNYHLTEQHSAPGTDVAAGCVLTKLLTPRHVHHSTISPGPSSMSILLFTFPFFAAAYPFRNMLLHLPAFISVITDTIV